MRGALGFVGVLPGAGLEGVCGFDEGFRRGGSGVGEPTPRGRSREAISASFKSSGCLGTGVVVGDVVELEGLSVLSGADVVGLSLDCGFVEVDEAGLLAGVVAAAGS